MSDLERDTNFFKQVLSSYPGGEQLKEQIFDGWSPPRRNPMDEEMRQLERLAQAGDLEAAERLGVMQRRLVSPPWTLFWDMHSGGSSKTNWDKIYIQAPEAEAITIFENRMGRNPHQVACSCCGPNFSISESETLAEASAYHRNCRYIDGQGYVEEQGDDLSTYQTLEDYIKLPNVLVIYDCEIEPQERL